MKMTSRRKISVGLTLLSASLVFSMGAAQAQSKDAPYPSKDIHIASAFPPGSGADVLVRFFAERIRAFTDKPVLVENKAGAGGYIATQYVVKAKPDGYTMYIHAANTLASNQYLIKNNTIDAAKEIQVAATINKQAFMLVVDASGSLNFGSGEHLKAEVITHLSALLGFAAAKNNDHVGLLLFTDQVEHFVPPKKGRGHIQRILRDLYFFKPKSSGTKVSVAVDHLQGILKKKSAVFVFSDFQDASYAQALRMMSKKHDVVACVIQDPAEREIPRMGLVDLEDAETGEVITVDSSSPTFQRAYKAFIQTQTADRERELRAAGVDRVEVISGEDFVQPLISYFRRKAGRR